MRSEMIEQLNLNRLHKSCDTDVSSPPPSPPPLLLLLTTPTACGSSRGQETNLGTTLWLQQCQIFNLLHHMGTSWGLLLNEEACARKAKAQIASPIEKTKHQEESLGRFQCLLRGWLIHLAKAVVPSGFLGPAASCYMETWQKNKFSEKQILIL